MSVPPQSTVWQQAKRHSCLSKINQSRSAAEVFKRLHTFLRQKVPRGWRSWLSGPTHRFNPGHGEGPFKTKHQRSFPFQAGFVAECNQTKQTFSDNLTTWFCALSKHHQCFPHKLNQSSQTWVRYQGHLNNCMTPGRNLSFQQVRETLVESSNHV